MPKPTDLDLRRNEIRSGRWGQWPAIGVVGFAGFVVLALLLVFGTVDGGVPGSRRGCRFVASITLDCAADGYLLRW
ncbi:MAG TPA: hypothetical protein VN609_05210 [Propionibacteriaceae bacterium]|nr:hypothetical protein [Propionibacteriaceae bacterium]